MVTKSLSSLQRARPRCHTRSFKGEGVFVFSCSVHKYTSIVRLSTQPKMPSQYGPLLTHFQCRTVQPRLGKLMYQSFLQYKKWPHIWISRYMSALSRKVIAQNVNNKVILGHTFEGNSLQWQTDHMQQCLVNFLPVRTIIRHLTHPICLVTATLQMSWSWMEKGPGVVRCLGEAELGLDQPLGNQLSTSWWCL